MLIGVVSDTHGNIANARAAVNLLGSFDVETVLHCGDIGSSDIPGVFTDYKMHYVFGNVDFDKQQLESAIVKAGGTCHQQFGELEIDGKKIALLHSHDAKKFHIACTSGDYDLVCYGHTHQNEHHLEGNTLILNPGALHRASTHTIAIVDLETMNVESLPI